MNQLRARIEPPQPPVTRHGEIGVDLRQHTATALGGSVPEDGSPHIDWRARRKAPYRPRGWPANTAKTGVIMSGKGYQTLLECRRRGFHLRGHGFSVDQIAVVLSLDHDVAPLRLYRYAAGLTAAQAVATFNALESTGAAPLRESRLYEYESWPESGRRPPARVLRLLAQIYGTHPAQLLAAETQATYSSGDQELLRE